MLFPSKLLLLCYKLLKNWKIVINVNWYTKCSYFLSHLTNIKDANYDITLILIQETKRVFH